MSPNASVLVSAALDVLLGELDRLAS